MWGNFQNMNIRSRMQLHMDLHCGDDSPDPISKRAFDNAVEFAELISTELNAEIKRLKIEFASKTLIQRLGGRK